MFLLANNDISVKNLWVDASALTGGGGIYTFLHRNSLGAWQRHSVENVITFKGKGFASDESAGANQLVSVTYKDCVPKAHNGGGFVFSKAFAYLHFHNCTVDFVGSTDPNYGAWVISNAQGVLFDNCDTTGSAGAGTGATITQTGFVLNGCGGVWFRKTQADTLEGRGYELIGCSGVQFDDAIAGLCASGVGFYFNACTDVTGYIRNSGRAGQTYAPAGVHGVAVDANNIRFRLDVQSNFATGDGLNITGPTGCMFGTIQCLGNVGRGLQSGSLGSFIVGNASFGSNAAGNYSIGSANHSITGAQLNSGSRVGPIVGPASA